jgi:hypothetical protein
VYKQANSKSAPAKLFLMGYIVTAACVIRTQSKQANKRPTTLLLNGQLLMLLLVPLQIIAFRARPNANWPETEFTKFYHVPV